MSISKQELRAIEGVVSKEALFVKLGKIWLTLHERFAIGRKQGRYLIFSSDDRSELVALVEGATGFDMSTHRISDFGDRIDTAGKIIGEKNSPLSVAHDMVVVRSLGGTVKFDEDYRNPPGGLLWMPLEQALMSRHQVILMVENLAVMRHIENAELPPELRDFDPLIVYRGDRAHSPKPVKQLLETYNGAVYAFCDADPAGIQIALSVPRCQGLLLPVVTVLEGFKLANKSLVNVQYQQMNNLVQRCLPPEIKRILKAISVHGGITQEASIAHKLQLSLYVI